MIRVGVVGVGSLGQHHVRVYSQLEGVKLAGLCDTDPARAAELAAKFHCQAFASPQEMLEAVDAVSVVVPTALHYKVTSPFLKRGIHVLLEKPMTTVLAEADALLRLAAKHRALLQVGHIERFNPAILALEQFELQPLFIEAHRLGPYSPRNTDIGVVLELMIHDIDIVLAMVRRKVERVEAVGIPVLSHTEDIANVRLNFKGGCVANLTASRVTNRKERKIRVFSKDAYVSVDYLAKEARLYKLKDGADPTQAGSLIGLTRMVVSERLKIKDEEQLKLELASFVQSIREGKRAVVTGKQGRDAVALGLEIQAQIKAHQKKVLS
jgi:predicted dehydrogenase